MFIIYLVNLLFYFSMCGFFLNYYYYLKSLMMIEFLMVSIFVILLLGVFGVCDYIIYILILSVCEGILGVLMVVLICRTWSVDGYFLIDYSF
uniref:NADH dehydrogenase subunit 4L n=1 Tax=Wallacidia oculata TaxID=590134 RepID=E0WBP2_9HYME|nr:NADH dehydrogenase subunit 4L [Wallacidia oculata]